MKRFFLYVTLLLCISSCVTNKKFQIMQKGDLHKDMPKDSVMRTYDPRAFDYKLQPYDVVLIRFESLTPTEFDFLNRTGAVQTAAINPLAAAYFGEIISPTGEVTYPVIGPIKIAGLTVFESQQVLQDLADKYLDSPKVIVRLMNFRVTFLGEMAREGQVTMPNNRVSLLEAIGLAGGLGEFADRANIKIIRQHGDKIAVQYVDVLDEDFINSPYFYVNQNDVVVVPPLRQKSFRRYFGPNLGLVSSAVAFLLLTFNFLKN